MRPSGSGMPKSRPTRTLTRIKSSKALPVVVTLGGLLRSTPTRVGNKTRKFYHAQTQELRRPSLPSLPRHHAGQRSRGVEVPHGPRTEARPASLGLRAHKRAEAEALARAAEVSEVGKGTKENLLSPLALF